MLRDPPSVGRVKFNRKLQIFHFRNSKLVDIYLTLLTLENLCFRAYPLSSGFRRIAFFFCVTFTFVLAFAFVCVCVCVVGEGGS